MHFVQFGCIWDCLVPLLGAKRAELVQKFVPRSCVRIFRYERTRSTALDPKLIYLVRFVLFGCIWDYLVSFQYSVQNGSNCCKSSCHEVALEFFTTNAPDPPHWTLNSCSGAFHTNFAIFGTVWLARKNTVQNGPTGAKVRATKSRRKFSQRTHPILLIGL